VILLQEIYASAPPGEDLCLTLTLTSSTNAFSGLPNASDDGAIRLARSFEEVVTPEGTYQPSGIGIQRPEKAVQGRQNLSFQLDNVSGEVLQAIQNAQAAGGTVYATVRVYRWNALSSGPVETPITLRMVGARVNRLSARIDCAFGDLANVTWNRTRYSTTIAPGLRYW